MTQAFISDINMSDETCAELANVDCLTVDQIVTTPAETWADVLLKTDLMTEKRVTVRRC